MRNHCSGITTYHAVDSHWPSQHAANLQVHFYNVDSWRCAHVSIGRAQRRAIEPRCDGHMQQIVDRARSDQAGAGRLHRALQGMHVAWCITLHVKACVNSAHITHVPSFVQSLRSKFMATNRRSGHERDPPQTRFRSRIQYRPQRPARKNVPCAVRLVGGTKENPVRTPLWPREHARSVAQRPAGRAGRRIISERNLGRS